MSDQPYTAYVYRKMDKFRKRCKVLEIQANNCIFEKDFAYAKLIRVEVTELIQKVFSFNLTHKGKRLKTRLLILEANLTIAIILDSKRELKN